MEFWRVEYRRVALVSAVLCVLLLVSASSVSGTGIAVVTLIISNVVCAIAGALVLIATAVAAVVMVLAGIKWTASENDPGARKAAKDAMIHAIVGLIIISIIQAVINVVISGTGGLLPLCP